MTPQQKEYLLVNQLSVQQYKRILMANFLKLNIHMTKTIRRTQKLHNVSCVLAVKDIVQVQKHHVVLNAHLEMAAMNIVKIDQRNAGAIYNEESQIVI